VRGIGGEDFAEAVQAASGVVEVVGGALGTSLAKEHLASVLRLEALDVHLVVGVGRQAHHGGEDAVGAHERVSEVRVLVHFKLASVKRGVPTKVAAQAAVVVTSVAAPHLAREVAGGVRVKAHAAQHGRVELELRAVTGA
jgi:hypothetical protein